MSNNEKHVPVMKLRETHAEERNRDSDAMAMFRIWSLLSGNQHTRDLTAGERKIT